VPRQRPAAIEHPVDDLLGDVEQAVQVRLDDLVPLLVRHLPERAVAGDTGVVDQHIDLARFAARPLDRIARRIPVGDVACSRIDVVALGAHLREPELTHVVVAQEIMGDGLRHLARTEDDELHG